MSVRATRGDNEHIPCVLIANSSGEGIAGTLDSSYYKGQGERQGIERGYIILSENNGQFDGKWLSEARNTGSNEWYVCGRGSHEDELGWHTDITDIDTKQCRW